MQTSRPSLSSRITNLGLTLLLIGVAFCTLALLSGTTRLGLPTVSLFVGAAVLLGLSRLLPRGR